MKDVEQEGIAYEFDTDYPSYTLLTKNLQNWFEEDYTERALSELPSDSISIAPVLVRVGHYNVLLAEANLYDCPGFTCVHRTGIRRCAGRLSRKEEFFDGTNKDLCYRARTLSGKMQSRPHFSVARHGYFRRR